MRATVAVLVSVSAGIGAALAAACSGASSAAAPGDGDASQVGTATEASAPVGDARPSDASADAGTVVDVRAMGAKGDGVTDDQPALNAAVAVLQSQGGHGTLYFPAGQYRAGKQTMKQSVIAFKDVTDVAIVFDPNAVLLVDNLENLEGTQGHGILFEGACRHVTMTDVHVAWKDMPAKRSLGDGIHVDGYPSDERSAQDFHLDRVLVERAPQAGIIFMGVSDIDVRNTTVSHTQADGLHFNACRNINVDTYTGDTNGDDSLALVTYYDATEIYLHKSGTEGPYNQPGLGAWSDTDTTVNHVHVMGGRADGIRIDSALRVHVSDVRVEDKGGDGVVIDGTEASDAGDGGDAGPLNWTVIASQGVVLDGVVVSGSGRGFHVDHQGGLGTPFDSPDRFWNFDVTLNNLTVNDNNDKIATGAFFHNVKGVTVNHMDGNNQTDFVIDNCQNTVVNP